MIRREKIKTLKTTTKVFIFQSIWTVLASIIYVGTKIYIQTSCAWDRTLKQIAKTSFTVI